MTSAEKLADRNTLFAAIDDIDAKLRTLFSGGTTYRAVAEARELLDIRAEQADALRALGGEPGPAPHDLPKVVAV